MPFTRLRFASVLRAIRPQRYRHRSEPVASCVVKHRHSSDTGRSTPGALAPVRVIVSRSIATYPAPSAPLAGTSQLHRPAAYMRCLRCAGAPRRPASGSALSLAIPSQHVALTVPGEPVAAYTQFLRDERLPSPRELNGSALPKSTFSGLADSLSLQPAELLASLSEAFTSGLSSVRSPSPPPDMTTVSTGQSPLAGLSPAGMAASVAARSPGSRTKSLRACQGLRPREVRQALALARVAVLPSASMTASAPRRK
jgi:hypothetical protein